MSPTLKDCFGLKFDFQRDSLLSGTPSTGVHSFAIHISYSSFSCRSPFSASPLTLFTISLIPEVSKFPFLEIRLTEGCSSTCSHRQRLFFLLHPPRAFPILVFFLCSSSSCSSALLPTFLFPVQQIRSSPVPFPNASPRIRKLIWGKASRWFCFFQSSRTSSPLSDDQC